MVGVSSLAHGSVRLLFCTMLCGAVSALPVKVEAADLASYKALYNVETSFSRTGSRVSDVQGKVYYEIKKSCEGWISNIKSTLDYAYANADPEEIETRSTSFEKFDGKTLNFSSVRRVDGEIDQETRGIATLTADGSGSARFSVPDNKTISLSKGTLFSQEQTAQLIKAAQQGQKIYNAILFDSADSSGPVEVNAVIGKKIVSHKDAKLTSDLVEGSGWIVREAIFRQDSEQQGMNDYEMTLELLENGVVKNLTADYRNFSMTQKLVAIEPINEECGAE